MSRAIWNSLRIVVGAEALTLGLGFLAAYAVARIPVRLARWVEVYFGLGFLIPAFAVLVPVFLLAARTGILYKASYLVAFYSAARLPLTIIVLASHMREIPTELEECAQIDGANILQIIRHIFFPLTRSGIVTVMVLNFLDVWNEYLFALVLLKKDNRTVQLALPLLRSERLIDYGLVAAGIVISLLPVYVVFVAFQERIAKGMLGGAVKG